MARGQLKNCTFRRILPHRAGYYSTSVTFCKSYSCSCSETCHFTTYISDCKRSLYFWDSWYHICRKPGMSKYICLAILQAFAAVWLSNLLFCCVTQPILVVGHRRRDAWPLKMRPISSTESSVRLKPPCNRPNDTHTFPAKYEDASTIRHQIHLMGLTAIVSLSFFFSWKDKNLFYYIFSFQSHK
jgi:hypothetical protein